MEQVVNHLAALGQTRIGFIGERLSVGRLNNMLSLLNDRSLDICDSHVKIGETRFEAGGYEQMKLLLEEPDLPTAVIAGYDQMAIGALKAVWEAGLDLPEDFSLVLVWQQRFCGDFSQIIISQFLMEHFTIAARQLSILFLIFRVL